MRICSEPGCGSKCPDDDRYCEACALEHGSASGRPTGADRAAADRLLKEYTTARWRRLRNLVLSSQPLCQGIRDDGKPCLTVAVVADHIIPAHVIVPAYNALGVSYSDVGGFYLRENLQSLCKSCNTAKWHADRARTDWSEALEPLLAKYRRTDDED